MEIILDLDKEGINLQETRLNLIHQGYGLIWILWFECVYRKAFLDLSLKIAVKGLKKEGLL